MAVTIQSRAIHMTALNDTYKGVVVAKSIRLTGSGLSPGTLFTLSDGGGSQLFHYVADLANANHEFLQGPLSIRDPKITAAGAGTWTLSFGL